MWCEIHAEQDLVEPIGANIVLDWFVFMLGVSYLRGRCATEAERLQESLAGDFPGAMSLSTRSCGIPT